MGFMHQLHLLLWKNISLKRRGPWVLAFEIFIPLVLFFILLGLRQKKPAIPVKEAFYSAAPLTSAGIIPIMQSLCPDGQRDEFGFLQYKNSTVTQLLERISEVVEQNRLFTSDRPGLGQDLETLQQHLESLSTAPLPPDYGFNSSSHGFPLAAMLKNQESFQQFLVRNLSLSNSTASTLLNSSVNLQEVYSLIFDSSLRNSGGPTSWIHGPKILSKKPADKLLQIKEKLLGGDQSMDGGEDPGRAANRKAVVQIISWALGLSAASGRRTEQHQGIQGLEGVLLTGSMLKFLTCGERGDIQLRKILLVPEKQQPALQAYHSLMCSREEGQRSERFRQLSKELREQINTQSVADQLAPVAPLSQSQLGALLKDLADVERLLKDVDLLSGLARLLPKGACTGQNPVSTSNGTWPLNATTWSINTTDVPREDGEEGLEGGGKKEGQENPHSQFSAFVQLWAGLQPILCGNNRIIEPEALKQGNMSSLGFTSKEQRNLGLLVHLMTTNPKILYSPIGSQVDKVIQKANETFAFVGNVTHYTRLWLNISAQLRTFLEEGRLQSHLLWLQQMCCVSQ